jgi:mRNA-degrading endonuclease RelE of RelBE toxin-antitoxin system
VPQYELLIEPEVYKERKRLPGHARQRIKQVFDSLVEEPRPPRSQPLDVTELNVPSGVEVRRLRMDRWRVIYAVNDDERWVWVLAICRRPPYDYEDLDDLVARLE